MNAKQVYLELDNILELEPGTVQGSWRLAELSGWDSLAVICFIAFAEERFKITLTGLDISACISVENLVALVVADDKQSVH